MLKYPLLKKIREFIDFLLEEDIRNDFKDDGKPYYILEEERDFMPSSVKGDYRLYRLQGGILAKWRNRLVARTEEGILRWELPGWSRAVAVSPDKTRFVATQDKSLCVFNAATAQPIGEEKIQSDYIDYLCWAGEKCIVGTNCVDLFIYDDEGKLINTIKNIVSDGGFLGGIAPDKTNADHIIILDVNKQRIKKVNIKSHEVLKDLDADYADQLLCFGQDRLVWTTIVNGTKLEEIKVYDSKNLREKMGILFRGKEGVRFAHQKPNDISYHSWISLPAIDPSHQFFLVNDNSGLLWLIDARTGDKRRIFRRDLLNYVYATLWLDEEHFVAIIEDGFVAKMNIRGKKLLFKQRDIPEEELINT